MQHNISHFISAGAHETAAYVCAMARQIIHFARTLESTKYELDTAKKVTCLEKHVHTDGYGRDRFRACLSIIPKVGMKKAKRVAVKYPNMRSLRADLRDNPLLLEKVLSTGRKETIVSRKIYTALMSFDKDEAL